MPIIIEGGSRSAGRWWTRHLQNSETNGRVQLVEIAGLSAETVPGMFCEMRALAQGTKCKNYFYQANINPRANEHLTPAQWRAAVETLGRNLGFEGQPYFVIEHEKEGRTHRHIIWSRIDQETMTAISDSLTARIHEQTSRQLEATFGLEAGKSILVPNREFERPQRRAAKHERFRGAQIGVDPHAIAKELKAMREHRDSGQSFRAAIEAAGYVLARGDRRDFVVVDRTGGDYSLARQLGMKAVELRAFMKDVEAASLPSVADAKTLQQQRQAVHAARQAQARTVEAAVPEPKRNRVSGPAKSRERQGRRAAPEAIVPVSKADAASMVRAPERHCGQIAENGFATLPQSGVVFWLDPDHLRNIANRLAEIVIPLPGITEARATFEFERYAAIAFWSEMIDIRSQQHVGADEAHTVRDQAEQADCDMRSLVQKASHGGQIVRKTEQALEIIPPTCRSAERGEEPRQDQEQREPERDR
jgi:hypothetical protein